MSDNINISVSSMMTFKEYFNTFVRSSNVQFSESWGWFIDIEANNIYIKQHSNHISIPQTINEIHSIRSFKSMINLHDETINFKINNILENKHNHKYVEYIIHSLGILGIVGVFYVCKIL